MWDDLVLVLKEILSVYQGLLDLSKAKREVLVAAKVDELDKITKQEEMLIVQAGKLEAKRQKLADKMAESLGIKRENLTLGKVKTALPEELQLVWGEMTEEFHKVNTELEGINQLNTKLIEQSLSFINYNMNVLARISNSPVYEAGGKSQPDQSARVLVDKKV